MVVKLMKGRQFAFVGDNPDMIRNAIEIANEIGAPFERDEATPKPGSTQLMIQPPVRSLS